MPIEKLVALYGPVLSFSLIDFSSDEVALIKTGAVVKEDGGGGGNWRPSMGHIEEGLLSTTVLVNSSDDMMLIRCMMFFNSHAKRNAGKWVGIGVLLEYDKTLIYLLASKY